MKRRAPSSLRLAALAATARSGPSRPPRPRSGRRAPGAFTPASPSAERTGPSAGTPRRAGRPATAVTYEGGLVPAPDERRRRARHSGVDHRAARRRDELLQGPLRRDRGCRRAPALRSRDRLRPHRPRRRHVSLSGTSGGAGTPPPLTVTSVRLQRRRRRRGLAPAQAPTRALDHGGSTSLALGIILLGHQVGNVSAIAIPAAFGYDNTRRCRRQGRYRSAPGALVATEPTFEWSASTCSPGSTGTSVVFATTPTSRRVQPDGGQVLAKRTTSAASATTPATRDPDLRPTPAARQRRRSSGGSARSTTPARCAIRTPTTSRSTRRSPPPPSITGGPTAPHPGHGPDLHVAGHRGPTSTGS